MYLYKATIFKDIVDVINIDEAQNNVDKNDFEANHKTIALQVDDVQIQETTFVFVKTYSEFKNLIDGVTYTWVDVRYIDDGKRYTFHLATENAI